MAKTRSQALSPTVKKEVHENKPNVEQLLHSTNNASKRKSKITKNRTPTQAQITKVKSENVDDNKVLLASPKYKNFTRSNITAEKIAKLIGYVVNDKMSVTVAAKKVGIHKRTALKYYREYRNDPKHKIPLPKKGSNKRPPMVLQQKINDLIHYVVNDRMNLSQAAKKVDINRGTATRYYAKYLEDPDRKIPLLNMYPGSSVKRCTQEEIADLIGYIVRDKMSLVEASKKANISKYTARKYYLKYLQDPNHEIPDPCESYRRSGKPCTNDQVSSLIGYIVNDGMSLFEASIKAHMGINSAGKYYNQYLDDPENKTPTPENNNISKPNKLCRLDQVKSFFFYLIVDKLNVTHASRKAAIPRSTAQRLYRTYFQDPTQETNPKNLTYSIEKMKRLVELVQNKKMSVTAAADLVHLSTRTARGHYQKYLKDPMYEFPANTYREYTQEDMRKLINYIINDKMSVCSAARKIKMNKTTAQKYYKKYQNDPEHKIPVPTIRGRTIKNRTVDKYTHIVADIYKNNPSIKPSNESHHPESDVLDIKLKKESIEDEAKILLKSQN